MARHGLSDESWSRICELMPEGGKPGKPWKDHRTVVDGILWIAATGSPWRDLPEEFGNWKTVYERFRRWCREGFWDQILEHLQVERNEKV